MGFQITDAPVSSASRNYAERRAGQETSEQAPPAAAGDAGAWQPMTRGPGDVLGIVSHLAPSILGFGAVTGVGAMTVISKATTVRAQNFGLAGAVVGGLMAGLGIYVLTRKTQAAARPEPPPPRTSDYVAEPGTARQEGLTNKVIGTIRPTAPEGTAEDIEAPLEAGNLFGRESGYDSKEAAFDAAIGMPSSIIAQEGDRFYTYFLRDRQGATSLLDQDIPTMHVSDRRVVGLVRDGLTLFERHARKTDILVPSRELVDLEGLERTREINAAKGLTATLPVEEQDESTTTATTEALTLGRLAVDMAGDLALSAGTIVGAEWGYRDLADAIAVADQIDGNQAAVRHADDKRIYLHQVKESGALPADSVALHGLRLPAPNEQVTPLAIEFAGEMLFPASSGWVIRPDDYDAAGDR